MSHLYPDQIIPGSDYERAITLENALRMLFNGVPMNMTQWIIRRYLNSHGIRLVMDMNLSQYEQQMREVTALIDQARNKLMIVPAYHVSPVDPSNVTPRGNP
jgi:predicted amidohydrolase YtcJ